MLDNTYPPLCPSSSPVRTSIWPDFLENVALLNRGALNTCTSPEGELDEVSFPRKFILANNEIAYLDPLSESSGDIVIGVDARFSENICAFEYFNLYTSKGVSILT